MKGYIKLKRKAFDLLNSKLSKKLYYHGVHHTISALQVCTAYLKDAKITGHKAKLLRIGILLHDIGFTVSEVDHEKESAKIGEQLMTEYNFSDKDIQTVKGLIMATRLPQSPNNDLEKIICDVDLDYLGRNDYFTIASQLYKELKSFSLIDKKSNWNKIQLKFLEAHKYHTDFALKNRQNQKEKRITELKQLLVK